MYVVLTVPTYEAPLQYVPSFFTATDSQYVELSLSKHLKPKAVDPEDVEDDATYVPEPYEAVREHEALVIPTGG